MGPRTTASNSAAPTRTMLTMKFHAACTPVLMPFHNPVKKPATPFHAACIPPVIPLHKPAKNPETLPHAAFNAPIIPFHNPANHAPRPPRSPMNQPEKADHTPCSQPTIWPQCVIASTIPTTTAPIIAPIRIKGAANTKNGVINAQAAIAPATSAATSSPPMIPATAPTTGKSSIIAVWLCAKKFATLVPTPIRKLKALPSCVTTGRSAVPILIPRTSRTSCAWDMRWLNVAWTADHPVTADPPFCTEPAILSTFDLKVAICVPVKSRIPCMDFVPPTIFASAAT